MTDFIPNSIASGLSEGPGLLLSNSIGSTTRAWEPQLPLLEKHFKVVRYDTRGHGDSATPDGDYSFDMLVADAFAVMDAHGLETASVMGCSLGSMTALGMGLSNPARVERIVCSAARADGPQPFVQSWDDRIAAIKANGIPALWDGAIGNWLTPAFKEANPDTVEMLKSEFLKTTPGGYSGCAIALKGLDYLKDLPKMSVPVLYVSGSEDKGAPPAVMQAMADATPDSDFAVIEGAGHIINVNEVKAFNLAICNFLGMCVD
ncbi:alpha/beta fold hydrolase [Alphaproteobacteria bacterium KMM 3653]|uniref:Alpha/beta fold hydrolase n=1 Tax=Harenicola maris TaxID=2841044 RepID=A0AAP2CP95_9RHOB|nr:alpha/beta fold hydrolase [Harenicola maris]